MIQTLADFITSARFFMQTEQNFTLLRLTQPLRYLPYVIALTVKAGFSNTLLNQYAISDIS